MDRSTCIRKNENAERPPIKLEYLYEAVDENVLEGTVAFSSEIAIPLDFTAEHAENAEG